MASAIDTVRAFRHLRVLVLGDAMLDSYLEGNAARLCAEGPVPVVRKTSEERLPGGAANTAANLAALGAEVIFLGVVGADPAGSLLRATLRDHDIPSCDLVVISDYNYGVVDDEVVARLRALRRERPCVLAVDSKNLGRFREAGATIITPNHLEAALAVDGAAAAGGELGPEEVKRVGRRLVEAVDADHVAV